MAVSVVRTGFSAKNYKKRDINQEIIDFALSNNLDFNGVITYLTENIKHPLESAIKTREEEHRKMQKEFAEQKRIESLPENRLPAIFAMREAYPTIFQSTTKTFPLKDFELVRNMTLRGELDHKLHGQKNDFLTWLNTVIGLKQDTESVGKKIENYLHLSKQKSPRGNQNDCMHLF